MKQIFILISCDAWHSQSSEETLGVYSTHKKAIKHLTKKYKLDEDDLQSLADRNQTQGKETNFRIEPCYLNQPI